MEEHSKFFPACHIHWNAEVKANIEQMPREQWNLTKVLLDEFDSVGELDEQTWGTKDQIAELRALLEALCSEIDANKDISTMGAFLAQTMMLNFMRSRAKTISFYNQNKEFIQANGSFARKNGPVVITCAPRTGTTLTQRLLALDPNARSPLTFELEEVLPPRKAGDDPLKDPRIESATASIAKIQAVAPGFVELFGRSHPWENSLPEESLIYTLSHNGINPLFYPLAVNPDKICQLFAQSKNAFAAVLRYEHRLFDMLDAYCPPISHWVIKAPNYANHFECVFAEYPNAKVIVCHRDPAIVAPSVTKLLENWNLGFFIDGRFDRRALKVVYEGLWEQCALGPLRYRLSDVSKESSFVDLYFDELMANPIATVKNIYAKLGLEYTPAFEDAMNAYLQSKPQEKFGRHVYTLDEFGYKKEEIYGRLGNYVGRFFPQLIHAPTAAAAVAAPVSSPVETVLTPTPATPVDPVVVAPAAAEPATTPAAEPATTPAAADAPAPAVAAAPATTPATPAPLSQKVAEKVAEWMSQDKNASTRAEIQHLVDLGDEKELSKRMLKRIAFGTAGLRGPMKAGYFGMNDLTVIQASQGLALYLEKVVADAHSRGVAIGYDGRYNSLTFAQLTAATFVSRGFKVYLYSQIVATPLVPYCVQQNNCCAGVMVTASHNPKNDNGYKVYWGNGCQIIPPHDVGIAASIDKNLTPWKDVVFDGTHRLIVDPLAEMLERYLSDIKRDFSYTSAVNGSHQHKIVYTAMHGVGAPYVKRAFESYGLPGYIPVVEQIDANPDFPTVEFPNPEEGKGALTLAFRTAESNGASIVFANDPDADRLAVAEKMPNGEWRVFSGNELGSLLGHWVWENYCKRHPDFDRKKGLMVASTVSSKFLRRMGEIEGFHFDEALTGFKWIGHRAIDLEKQGYTFIFGFEEAIGFMIGNTCWDKDGVRAAAVFAEFYHDLANRNLSLSMQLENLYAKYGRFVSKVHYYFCYDPLVMTEIFDDLRRDGCYPDHCGKYKIVAVRDLTTGYDSSKPDGLAVLPVDHKSHMITFTFENNCVVTLRGSGTEPKLKYYVELYGNEDADVLNARLADMTQSVIDNFLNPQKNGLVKPKD